MHANCVLWLALVIVLESFAAGLPKMNEEKHEKRHHETKSKVHESHEASPQTLLKTAPLGFGIGLKAHVPTKHHHKDTKNDDKDVKTESETTTDIKNGLKTVTTVTKQIRKDKDNMTQVVAQSVQSMTTNVFDPKKPEKFKFKAGKPKKGVMFNFFNPFGLFADEHVLPQCSSKTCKGPGMYCDRMDHQCREKVEVGGRCDQAGQCKSTSDKKVVCQWGTCADLNKSYGSAGIFCKNNKDCGDENLHCALQRDISEVSNVCIYKLSEGQTCGRRNMFSFFSLGEEPRDLACKKGFTCSSLEFSGRKICRRAGTHLDKNSNDDGKEDEESEDDEESKDGDEKDDEEGENDGN